MANPDIATRIAELANVPRDAVEFFLRGVDDDYLAAQSPETAAEHLAILGRLRSKTAFEKILVETGETTWNLALAIPDHWGVFSVTAGLLTISGLNILEAMTYSFPMTKTDIAKALLLFKVERLPTADPHSPDWPRFEAELGDNLKALAEGRPEVVRERIYRRTLSTLDRKASGAPVLFHPIDVTISSDPAGRYTLVDVASQDSPGFLHLFTNALSLRQVFIQKVAAHTENNRIRDRFFVTDLRGAPITDPAKLRELHLAVILAKEFSQFLAHVPDPVMALRHFDELLDGAIKNGTLSPDYFSLEKPETLETLGRVLGTSDFLWEDMIRTEAKQLLPLLGNTEALDHRLPRAELAALLKRNLASGTHEEKITALNQFKDRQILRIDLRQILGFASPAEFEEELSDLADVLLTEATGLAETETARRQTPPRAQNGNPLPFALFGLGKLGGRELGHASDLELLAVYDPAGEAADADRMSSGEYFSEVVRELLRVVKTRRSGIFEIDLRLRPFGTKGPLAASLTAFRDYYHENGPAAPFERQALVRLRPILGPEPLVREILSARDAFVYSSAPFPLAEIAHLRKRQAAEFVPPGAIHAKYTHGALADIEYYVQHLQILHGRHDPSLRRTNTLAALTALTDGGHVSKERSDILRDACLFWKQVIDALRILRGNAKDLTFPSRPSEETELLARRMGRNDDAHGAALLEEIRRRLADIRGVTGDWDRLAFLSPVALALLSTEPPSDEAARSLADLGFRDPAKALKHLFAMAGESVSRETLAELWGEAEMVLRGSPDPDRVLLNWRRFVEAVPSPISHFLLLRDFPYQLALLLKLFGVSQYLADILVWSPELFSWLIDSGELGREKSAEDFLREARDAATPFSTEEGRLDALRAYKRREMLRIGARDYEFGADMETVTREISNLAEGILSAAWEMAGVAVPLNGAPGVVFAFGKLGGMELNYSSDIDLVFLFDAPEEALDGAIRFAERFIDILTRDTTKGYVFRVDMRLRPFGSIGRLVATPAEMLRYYRESAADWELQALLKVRPIAGDRRLGVRMLRELRAFIYQSRDSFDGFLKMKAKLESEVITRGEWERNVKTGEGGIRDIEFTVQLLQLRHGAEDPTLHDPNTLTALGKLVRAGKLDAGDAAALKDAYIFLRKVEHLLQIYDDQQVHTLPADPKALDRVARRFLPGAGQAVGNSGEIFLKEYREKTGVVRKIYEQVRGMFRPS